MTICLWMWSPKGSEMLVILICIWELGKERRKVENITWRQILRISILINTKFTQFWAKQLKTLFGLLSVQCCYLFLACTYSRELESPLQPWEWEWVVLQFYKERSLPYLSSRGLCWVTEGHKCWYQALCTHAHYPQGNPRWWVRMKSSFYGGGTWGSERWSTLPQDCDLIHVVFCLTPLYTLFCVASQHYHYHLYHHCHHDRCLWRPYCLPGSQLST